MCATDKRHSKSFISVRDFRAFNDLSGTSDRRASAGSGTEAKGELKDKAKETEERQPETEHAKDTQ